MPRSCIESWVAARNRQRMRRSMQAVDETARDLVCYTVGSICTTASQPLPFTADRNGQAEGLLGDRLALTARK